MRRYGLSVAPAHISRLHIPPPDKPSLNICASKADEVLVTRAASWQTSSASRASQQGKVCLAIAAPIVPLHGTTTIEIDEDLRLPRLCEPPRHLLPRRRGHRRPRKWNSIVLSQTIPTVAVKAVRVVAHASDRQITRSFDSTPSICSAIRRTSMVLSPTWVLAQAKAPPAVLTKTRSRSTMSKPRTSQTSSGSSTSRRTNGALRLYQTLPYPA